MLKLLLLPPLIKALLATRQPLLCALIYGAALFTNSLMIDAAFGADPRKIAWALLLNTGAAFGFFWALRESEDMGALYWVVLVIGVAILFVL